MRLGYLMLVVEEILGISLGLRGMTTEQCLLRLHKHRIAARLVPTRGECGLELAEIVEIRQLNNEIGTPDKQTIMATFESSCRLVVQVHNRYL